MENLIDKKQDSELQKHIEDNKHDFASLNRKIDILIRNDEETRKATKPILDVFTTASTLGKWLMGVLVFISILIGIIFELFKIFKK
jgi:hypothetical protein